MTGYSTERSEAYQFDASRCNTLDMKARQHGSSERLANHPPNSPGVHSNTATRTVQYKKLNDSVGGVPVEVCFWCTCKRACGDGCVCDCMGVLWEYMGVFVRMLHRLSFT